MKEQQHKALWTKDTRLDRTACGKHLAEVGPWNAHRYWVGVTCDECKARKKKRRS